MYCAMQVLVNAMLLELADIVKSCALLPFETGVVGVPEGAHISWIPTLRRPVLIIPLVCPGVNDQVA